MLAERFGQKYGRSEFFASFTRFEYPHFHWQILDIIFALVHEMALPLGSTCPLLPIRLDMIPKNIN